MTLSAFGFRQFARTRHTGAPSNPVAPACEFRLSSKSVAGAMPVAVNFGLGPDANSITVRQECRRAMLVRVNLGRCRMCPVAENGTVHVSRLGLACGLYGHAKLANRDKGSFPRSSDRD